MGGATSESYAKRLAKGWANAHGVSANEVWSYAQSHTDPKTDGPISWNGAYSSSGRSKSATSAASTAVDVDAANAATRQAGMAALKGSKMFDIDGNEVDLSTMTYDQIAAMCRNQPNSKMIDTVSETVKALCKTPGSSMYGQTYDADDFKPVGNKQQSDAASYMGYDSWNEWANSLNGAFYADNSPEHQNADIETYTDYVDTIEQSDMTPYEKKILRQSIDEQWSAIGRVPDEEELNGWLEQKHQYETDKAKYDEYQESQASHGWFDGVTDFIFGKKEEQEPVEEP